MSPVKWDIDVRALPEGAVTEAVSAQDLTTSLRLQPSISQDLHLCPGELFPDHRQPLRVIALTSDWWEVV